jgi:hypothetical protein
MADPTVAVTTLPTGELTAAPNLAGAVACGPGGLVARNRRHRCVVYGRSGSFIALGGNFAFDYAEVDTFGGWDPSQSVESVTLPFAGWWLIVGSWWATSFQPAVPVGITVDGNLLAADTADPVVAPNSARQYANVGRALRIAGPAVVALVSFTYAGSPPAAVAQPDKPWATRLSLLYLKPLQLSG